MDPQSGENHRRDPGGDLRRLSVSPGASGPGPAAVRRCTVCDREAVDGVIAKGQGNYETLNDAPGNLFFLFQAKCRFIARDAGVEIGKYMLVCRSRSAKHP